MSSSEEVTSLSDDSWFGAALGTTFRTYFFVILIIFLLEVTSEDELPELG